MNRMDLIQKLADLDRRGVYVLAKRDIEKLFPAEGEKAMEISTWEGGPPARVYRRDSALPRVCLVPGADVPPHQLDQTAADGKAQSGATKAAGGR